MMLSFVAGDGWPRSWALNALLLVFVAVMMVSRVPTYSFKRVRVEPHMVLPTLLVAFVVIAGLVTETWLTLSIIAGIYLLSIPLSVWTAGRMRRRDQPHPAASAATAAGAPAQPPAAPEDPSLPPPPPERNAWSPSSRAAPGSSGRASGLPRAPEG
jgi:CDP-diacylglycerol--serine O-phosphatidyltransferase